MIKIKYLQFALAAIMAFSLNAEAKLYKWVDEKGVTHYGEVIPPEYANAERDSLKKSGMIEKRPEKITPEMIRAKEEAEAKRKADNQAQIEQQRRNSALLNTYSNENEIDMARERSMVLLNARIDTNKMLLKSSQNALDEHKKDAEKRTQAGRKIPQSLHDDIAEDQSRVDKYTLEISKNEAEVEALKARYDGEKELFRKLKGTGSKQ